MRLAAVVLAGGESRRFQGDKYLFLVSGSAVLARVVSAAAAVPEVERVWLSLREERRWEQLRALVPAHVEPLFDSEHRGPGAGLLASAERALRKGVGGLLVVAGDLAWVTASALARAVELCRALEVQAAAPLADSAPMVLVALRSALKGLLELARARGKPRFTDAIRCAERAALASVDLLGEPRCFADVDYREDLERPREPFPAAAPLVLVEWGRIAPALEAAWCWRSRPEEAVEVLLEESLAWRRRGAHLLSLHAALDAIIVARSSGLESSKAEREADTARRLLELGASARS